MRRTIAGLLVLACAAGVGAGELIYRSAPCRDWIGRLRGRGRLLALVQGRGIYELDLRRKIEAGFDAAGIKARDAIHALAPNDKREQLMRLVANQRVRQASESESISEADVERAFAVLQFQFADKKIWARRLRESGLSADFMRRQLRDDLRARKWIEHQIANGTKIDENSCRQFYEAHRKNFVQSLRLRASHLFLAAPPEAAPEVVAAKRMMIDSLAARIAHGEDFSALVAEASEDEATKWYGGDLGYFSSWRMPEEFFTAVGQLRLGEFSKPIRSHLGFHLIRVTDIRPPREMSYDEAQPEIIRLLGNELRQSAVRILTSHLAEHGKYFSRAL